MLLLNGINSAGLLSCANSIKISKEYRTKSITIAVTSRMPDKSIDIVADKIRKII